MLSKGCTASGGSMTSKNSTVYEQTLSIEGQGEHWRTREHWAKWNFYPSAVKNPFFTPMVCQIDLQALAMQYIII